MKKRSKLLSVLLAAAMLLSVGAFAASEEPSAEQAADNSSVSQYIATQGMVLLENNGALPIAKSGKLALFGGGVYNTVKGGTGSGDVNVADVITVWEGFADAGYEITSLSYLEAYQTYYDEAQAGGASGGPFSEATKVDDLADIDAYIAEAVAAGTDTALYVVSRNSGEGSDRSAGKLDYLLGDNERLNLEKIAAAFDKVIVVLNVGGIVDTAFYKEIEGLDALLLMSQAGMNGGAALVQVVNGEVTPSGKLTDTWALHYEDYPTSAHFANNDGDALHEVYTEDIFIGYRYFDSFGLDVAYPFGYGLSYTDFAVAVDGVTADENTVSVTATVTNTGAVCSGKEVVEVYFSAPQGAVEVPYQELAAYGKTDELAPGESQTLTVSFNTAEMSSYDMSRAAYVMAAGDYILRVGTSSRDTHVAAVLSLNKEVVTEQLSNQMVQDQDIDVLSNADATPITYDGEAEEIAAAERIELKANSFMTLNNASAYEDEAVVSYVTAESDYQPVDQVKNERYTKNTSSFEPTLLSGYAETLETVATNPDAKLSDVASGAITMEELVGNLSVKEMADIVEGTGMGGGSGETMIGGQSNTVSGAAGDTTSNYFDTRDIPDIVLSDGPAGIRINSYCTHFPIGTMIAQTWDPEVMAMFGDTIGLEMEKNGITLWLAPGMNIHTNPLCGRNFEYYSEDPLVAGLTAGYTTRGVQSHNGVGVTLKHYCGNSQETNRNAENNSVTERALREIYLKGFEIAVKMAQPMALMTSYNENNSIPSADNYDQCTDILRGEWGFKGLVMTDWGGGQSVPVNSMHAGNDLIMPGGSNTSIVTAVDGGVLPLGDLQKSAAHVLNIIMQSSQFEDLTGFEAGPYSAKFELAEYLTLVKGSAPSAEPSGEIR